ncbi:hypothetical protein NDU88_005879 [Pleurodeles waltl]|uniref:Uncharacterized protein n=1 Tax=Pleurodeles waltl TaxID=8319 RepID=A0AAV7SMY1_PLEWA|nr:hypothetical protein NDU88_005879 [Pleurodeles waltl]
MDPPTSHLLFVQLCCGGQAGLAAGLGLVGPLEQVQLHLGWCPLRHGSAADEQAVALASVAPPGAVWCDYFPPLAGFYITACLQHGGRRIDRPLSSWMKMLSGATQGPQ